MPAPLVIYHAHCLDGFGAAYAAWARLCLKDGGKSDFHAANHGSPIPPEAAGRDVYIVDFSYKRPELKQLCDLAASVTILDHHISAEHDLAGLEDEHANLSVVFDMDKSGAVLAWEHFHASPVPMLLLHVQDRDLWTFEYEGSRNTTAALMSHPFSFEFWHSLTQSPDALNQLLTEGAAINRFRDQMIATYRDRAYEVELAGYKVPVVNCPREIASELLGELAEGRPFAAGYLDKAGKRSWSLRAAADGIDVAALAERFGGGGHRRAAGFAVALDECLPELPEAPAGGD